MTLHIRGGRRTNILRGLRRTGHEIAIVGHNRLWTSLIPVDAQDIDLAMLAKHTQRPVIRLWFDSDSAVTVQSHTSTDFLGELTLSFIEDEVLAPDDEALLLEWMNAGLLSKTRASRILRLLHGPKCHEWACSHGLETEMGLPYFDPIPTSATPAERRAIATELISSSTRPSPSEEASTSNTPKPPAGELTTFQSRIVELHTLYFERVWNGNSWKLYNKYKKHLHPTRRHEVDDLLTELDQGCDTATLRLAIATILQGTWDDVDWVQLLRDPAILTSDFVDDDTVGWWQRQLEDL